MYLICHILYVLDYFVKFIFNLLFLNYCFFQMTIFYFFKLPNPTYSIFLVNAFFVYQKEYFRIFKFLKILLFNFFV